MEEIGCPFVRGGDVAARIEEAGPCRVDAAWEGDGMGLSCRVRGWGGWREAGSAGASERPVMGWAGGGRAREREADVDVVGLGGGQDEG